MRSHFQIGTYLNRPVYYYPRDDPAESESVFCSGKNQSMHNIAHYIMRSICNADHIIWVSLILNENNNDTIKCSLLDASSNIMREFFNWDDETVGYYELVRESILHQKVVNLKDAMMESIQHNVDDELIAQKIKTAIEDPIFCTSRYSPTITEIIKIMRKKEYTIYPINITKNKGSMILSLILSELKRIILESRSHGYDTPVGICIDHMDFLIQNPLSRKIIHDLFYSWGRTYRVIRIGIDRQIYGLNELFSDEFATKSLLNSDGMYSIVLVENQNGTFRYINRLKSSNQLIVKKIAEVVIETEAPLHYMNVQF